ncbi:Ribosomal_protein S13 [Hexamita inflata]|uniref:Ribosomal protein S13 n=1 Tax=Hexamita inflata TaxID=28002 RepID=A0AA86QUH5_9EUKA|nr:Ribosomal protein S13 [Hexamita inflata]CAI9963382.1 Ribosomal protein S13 [Hexamita inflata]
MARVYSKGHGKSGSALPYVRRPASWQKKTTEDIVSIITGLAKKGMMPSKIGSVLRDQFAIGLINHYTGTRVTRILRAAGVAPEIPEDLYFLIKRAVQMRKHLERNPRDISTKYHLILVESRIYRISRYYKSTKKVPATFRYQAKNAAALLASFA